MDDWTEAEFQRRATAAGNAFEDLRKRLQRAEASRDLPQPDDVIGRYRIIRELGQGGFGSVFEVQHDLLGHRFAMKLLNPHIAADPSWVRRFKEEARVTSLIVHENLVFVTDFGEDETWGSYFVMELLTGEPLDQTIAREGLLTAERVARFAHAAASAFAAVHEVGIVHCDLKPSNVFTTNRPPQPEQWKFLDFGTSTVVMAASQTQALYGTPVYMAPEQAIGESVTPLADQFSLSAIMYEMLTGKPPWAVTSWLMATADLRAKTTPAPPSTLSAQCPRSWDDVILRGLSLDPSARWPSVEALARALDEGLGIHWKPSADPLDARGGTPTIPSVEIIEARTESLVVDVATGESTEGRATVRVKFQTRERFIREVHRNLSVGGLFVPSEELLSLREPVLVELILATGERSAPLSATVVGHELRRDSGRGFGVAFASHERDALDAFIEDVRGPTLQPETVLCRTDVPVPDTLTPGEWFVLSRIGTGAALKELRSLCAGLPVDVHDLVGTLIARKLACVAPSRPAGHKPSAGKAVRESLHPMPRADVGAILERVDYHRHQANYLGASDTLLRAIEMSPSVAVFHYRLAALRMEFEGDPRAALPAAKRAADLDPKNELYRGLVESIQQRS